MRFLRYLDEHLDKDGTLTTALSSGIMWNTIISTVQPIYTHVAASHTLKSNNSKEETKYYEDEG